MRERDAHADGRRKIGLLGTRLDHAAPSERWDAWRPTVSLFQHDDLEPARLVLLAERRYARLAETVAADVRSVSPATAVEVVKVASGQSIVPPARVAAKSVAGE